MARVRRTRYLLLYLDDQPFLDVALLLRGVAHAAPTPRLRAISLLTGGAAPLWRDDLDLIMSIPLEDWVEEPDGAGGRARELARAGALLSDADEPLLAELRKRDEALADVGWNLYGALYHLLTRWSSVDLRQGGSAEIDPPSAELVRDFFRLQGPPPAALRPVASGAVELPVVETSGPLHELLGRRRTTRSFDRSGPLPLEELAVVLDTVFGVRGYARVLGQVLTLKRTSPSGGGLHPVEAYPLVRAVEGVDPGLYRYSAHDHALELVEALSRDDAGALVGDFVCGQTFLAGAHVHVVLAARFERAFWKYRRQQRGYALMLMDAAHLSQTLYLVATDRGLGAYVTASVNGADIDRRLGLDGIHEGTLAVCGFGKPAGEPSPFDPAFTPYLARRTDFGDSDA
jgi:putative peptide maturation dehydrogenase